MPNYEWALLPKQKEFIQAEEPRVLFSGAVRAGKTQALLHKALKGALIPGNRVGLCRKYFTWLRQTTLRTLLEGDGTPPILPPNSYTHNESKHQIKVIGGGEILYFGIDNIDSIMGSAFGEIAVDEAVDLDEADWLALETRLSLSVKDIDGKQINRNQLYSACNPGPPSHFLAKLFGISGPPHPGHRLIQTSSRDNFLLPKSYIESLEHQPESYKQRMVEGLWVGLEGAVYGQEWNRRLHMLPKSSEDWTGTIGVIDWGFADPSVLLTVKVTPKVVHIYREFYESGCTPSKFIQVCIDRAKEDHIDYFIADPSRADNCQELRDKGYLVKPAINSINEGITLVKKRLMANTLTVDPGCIHTVEEFESYMWKPGTDKPVDACNHTMDTVRYLCQDQQYPEPVIYGSQDFYGVEDDFFEVY